MPLAVSFNHETNHNVQSSRLNELANMPVGKLLLRYSVPSVVGMVVTSLYNIVDRVFIGQIVGSDAIAGLAITFPLMNISTALGVLIGAGSASRVSLLLGNRDDASARKVLGNALTLTIVIGLIYCTLFSLFVDPVLELFGATERTIPYARDMMLYVLPGLFLTNIAFSFNNVMRASGFPKKAMYTMFIGAIVNTGLDPIFIYVLGWGIKGAAIATDIAMAVSALFVMWHFIKPHGEVHFQKGTYRLQPRIIKAIIAIGAAPCIVNIASCLINILINRSLHEFGGDDAIAAAGVFVTATSFVVCIVLGICQGMQPIIGYNYGAGQLVRVRHCFWMTAAISTVVCAVGSVAGLIFPDAIASAFIKSPELIAKTGHYLRIAMTMFWMVGFQVVSTTFFQAIGQANKSILLSLFRQVLFLIPLLLLLPIEFGLIGIWASFPTSDFFATIVTALLVYHQFRHFKHNSTATSI